MKLRHLYLLLALIGLGMQGCNGGAVSTATAVPATLAATATLPKPSATLSVAPTITESPPPTATTVETSTLPTEQPTEIPPAEVQFMAVGDLMLGRTIGDRILSQGHPVVFAAVQSVFEPADILVGNLECVISDVGAPQPKGYTFRAPPEAALALADAGFDLVSLANNHTLDYGIDGLADMMARLRESGIASAGAGIDGEAARAPVILVRNGLRVAILSYVNVPVERTGFDTRRWAADILTPGIAWAEPETIAADVKIARALADVVIVMLHVGLEGQPAILPLQTELAHAAVDAGAALVLGTHSHVLETVERYNGGLIAYSLGNFVFDGFGLPANYSAILRAKLTLRGVESYDWVPVVVTYGLPRMATDNEAAEILPRVREK